jgi:hypothetical protein
MTHRRPPLAVSVDFSERSKARILAQVAGMLGGSTGEKSPLHSLPSGVNVAQTGVMAFYEKSRQGRRGTRFAQHLP